MGIVDCMTRMWLCYNGLEFRDVMPDRRIPASENVQSRIPGLKKVGLGLESLVTCTLCSGIPSTPIPNPGIGKLTRDCKLQSLELGNPIIRQRQRPQSAHLRSPGSSKFKEYLKIIVHLASDHAHFACRVPPNNIRGYLIVVFSVACL
jgi:hypothetical protein